MDTNKLTQKSLEALQSAQSSAIRYAHNEVDTDQGSGVVFRQGPHQTDIVRFLGGGLVRDVRAQAEEAFQRLEQGWGGYAPRNAGPEPSADSG